MGVVPLQSPWEMTLILKQTCSASVLIISYCREKLVDMLNKTQLFQVKCYLYPLNLTYSFDRVRLTLNDTLGSFYYKSSPEDILVSFYHKNTWHLWILSNDFELWSMQNFITFHFRCVLFCIPYESLPHHLFCNSCTQILWQLW